MNAASSFSNTCSTSILRFSNGVLAVICSILVYDIITLLRPALSDRKATLYALVLALYPLHWFFTFLYYTDVASLTAVLATYLTCMKRKYWISALVRNMLYFSRKLITKDISNEYVKSYHHLLIVFLPKCLQVSIVTCRLIGRKMNVEILPQDCGGSLLNSHLYLLKDSFDVLIIFHLVSTHLSSYMCCSLSSCHGDSSSEKYSGFIFHLSFADIL